MINMQIAKGFSIYRYGSLNGEPSNFHAEPVPEEKYGEVLLALEKEADKNYDAIVSSVRDEDKLSKAQFKTGSIARSAPWKLRLDDDDKAGIEGIAKATGFSRTTVLSFYELSIASGIVRDMREFVGKAIGEPTITYGRLKNTLSEEEGAKILSTLGGASRVADGDKLSQAQLKTGNTASSDPAKLQLDDDDKAGIEGIAEATGFSRTTVLNFYALSLSSGLVRDMNEFVSEMIAESTQTYGHLKNGLSEKEGAKILSTLA